MAFCSIRCQRDKKRKVIDESWLKTCSYLCPKCYYKLDEAARRRYAPQSAINVKPEENPSAKDLAEIERFRAIIAKQSSTVPEEPPPPPRKRGRPKGSKNVSRSLLEDLKPKHTINCKKCGKTVPCFSAWYETSKVLCPTCYYSMSEKQRQDFNQANQSATGDLQFRSEFNAPTWNRREPDSMATISGCSSNWIRYATKEELLAAVKRGRVSRIRAKIELKRRASSAYFSGYCDGEEAISTHNRFSMRGW